MERFALSLSVARNVAYSVNRPFATTLAGMLFFLLAAAFIASMQSFDSVELWTDLGIHVVFFLLHCSTVLYVCLLQHCPISCNSILCGSMAHYQIVQPWIDCPTLFLFSSLLYSRSFGGASCIAAFASALSSILFFMDIALLHSISIFSVRCHLGFLCSSVPARSSLWYLLSSYVDACHFYCWTFFWCAFVYLVDCICI